MNRNAVSDAHCFEGLEKIHRRENIVLCPEIHVCDQVVWNIAGNCQLFVGGFKSPVEGFHNLLVKFQTHRGFQIRNYVHLCEK